MALPNKFPTKPTPKITNHTYPEDLIQDADQYNKRMFYTQIEFVKYSVTFNYRKPIGGINLPIPRKLNEMEILQWEPNSLLSLGASAAYLSTFNQSASSQRAILSGIGRINRSLQGWGTLVGGAGLGLAVNPFLWMLFKTPDFKEFDLSWTLVANNPQESETIAGIIKYLKFHSLPTLNYNAFYGFPDIALIKFHPEDKFTFKMKPCAVMYVAVDYSGAGAPSFFKNGAPTVVNLTLRLKEIELWTQNSKEWDE